MFADLHLGKNGGQHGGKLRVVGKTHGRNMHLLADHRLQSLFQLGQAATTKNRSQ